MRRILVVAAAAIVLAVINLQIGQKERLLRAGEPVYLRLAPVDPRSLMQGDYMVLNYEISAKLPEAAPADGHVVIAIDGTHVAQFVRVHAGEGLGAGERLLRYRKRGRRLRIGAESYFFEEGTGDTYANAKYGELRLAPSGDSVLVGLRDEKLNALGPAR